jgi:hypothetical protein
VTEPQSDQGSITLWVLGLCVAVLALGGLSVDLWRGVSERRALFGLATAAATAGASGIDTELWRTSGELRLDSDRAVELARRAAARQPRADELSAFEVSVAELSVEVSVARPVPMSLLRLVGLEQLTVRASAVAEPAASR